MHIKWLQDIKEHELEEIGTKAYNQALLKLNGINIPNGFCLSSNFISKILIKTTDDINALDRLHQAYNKLISNTKSHKLIVRSSSSMEDKEGHLFPGIFNSQLGISSFQELLDGINYCSKSINDLKVADYSTVMGIHTQIRDIPLLVQEQIDGQYFGQSKVEYHDNKYKITTEAVTAEKLSILNSSSPNYESTYVFNPNTADGIFKGNDELKEVSTYLIQNIKNLKVFKFPLLIEWGLTSSMKVYVFQIRHFPSNNVDRKKQVYNLFNVFFKDFKQIGLKASAMEYFKRENWFHKDFLLFKPIHDIEDILKKLDNSNFDERGITVRFSHKENIGLPRKFCHNLDEVKEFIKKHWNNKWSCIIYSYMNIENSFELWVNHSNYILERVPGLWESDNKLTPDIVYNYSNNISINLVQENRLSIEELVGGKRISKHIQPLKQTRMNEWINRLETYVTSIRKDFDNMLPLNFHFVEDENHNWNFLNIRYAEEIEEFIGDQTDFFIVEDYHDFKDWDKVSNILLKITVERGSEINYQAIKKYIPIGSTIFVEFGLLSHPAIALRELGYKVTRFVKNNKENKS